MVIEFAWFSKCIIASECWKSCPSEGWKGTDYYLHFTSGQTEVHKTIIFTIFILWPIKGNTAFKGQNLGLNAVFLL